MRQIIISLLIITILSFGTSVFGASDLVEVQNRVTKVQTQTITGPNAPAGMDKTGYVGVILSKIFDATGRIKNEFVTAFQSIQGNYINTVPKWDGQKFVAGTISDVGGNIGIGTITPSVKLDINGNIKTRGSQVLFGIGDQRIQSDNNTAFFLNSNNNTDTQLILRDRQNLVYGKISGADNGNLFGLVDGDNNWSYINRKDVYSEFRINNTGIIRMQANGNVGIGVTAPTQRLDINGKIRMRSQTVAGDTLDTVATKGYVDDINQTTSGKKAVKYIEQISSNNNSWRPRFNGALEFWVIGGGGAGAGVARSDCGRCTTYGVQGGSAGGVSIKSITALTSQSFQIRVGRGGSAGSGNPRIGNDGTDSVVSGNGITVIGGGGKRGDGYLFYVKTINEVSGGIASGGNATENGISFNRSGKNVPGGSTPGSMGGRPQLFPFLINYNQSFPYDINDGNDYSAIISDTVPFYGLLGTIVPGTGGAGSMSYDSDNWPAVPSSPGINGTVYVIYYY